MVNTKAQKQRMLSFILVDYCKFSFDFPRMKNIVSLYHSINVTQEIDKSASWCWNIFKVHIFWEGHKILRNLHQLFDLQYIGQIHNWWKFRKILWPSQNIWTLLEFHYICTYFCSCYVSRWQIWCLKSGFYLPSFGYQFHFRPKLLL